MSNCVIITREMFTQNADLDIQHTEDLKPSQTGPAYSLLLSKFDDPEDMVQWEFAAYEAYTAERCDEEKIETLDDLFGVEFHKAFRAQHRVLLALDNIKETHLDIQRLQENIAKLQAVVDAGGQEEETI